MQNLEKVLLNYLEESVPLVTKYEDETAAVLDEIQKNIQSETLHIMVYGAYNAGKSSLINAMSGEERAATGDIPTTDRVDVYDWNGFTLLDTPGVNAPIAHQEMTEEQIKRCSLFLFVIREGDQDVKDVYVRLLDLLNRKKKVFIVFNHEIGQKKDLATALMRVNQLLLQHAQEYGAPDSDVQKVAILPMNAKTALKARLKQSEMLLERSGYIDFLQIFATWAAEHDNETQRLKHLQQHVDEVWFAPVLARMAQEVGSGDDTPMQSLVGTRRMLENKKRLLINSAYQKIQQEVQFVRASVNGTLQETTSESELNAALQRVFAPVVQRIEEWLQSQMESVASDFALAVNYERQIENVESSSPMIDVTREALKYVDQDAIYKALLLGRKLKIPFLKGRWGKTFETWAGRGAWMVQVVLAIWEIYDANSKQERQNEQNRQQALALHQAVEQICSTAANDLHTIVSKMISTIFDAQTVEIQSRIEEIHAGAVELTGDMAQLERIRGKLMALSYTP